jgi:hypothetical protein
MRTTARDPTSGRVATAGARDETLGWLVRQRAWELRMAQLEEATPPCVAATRRASSMARLPAEDHVIEPEQPVEHAQIPDRRR